MKPKYLKRIADSVLHLSLEASGAVLIEGPKWCGKTRTAEEIAASSLYMQDPNTLSSNLLIADTKPSLLLRGKAPRLIDEWQVAPVLWDAVRFAVDQRGGTGHFILTGSAVPADNAILHTGTGRISRMVMHTMSLFESDESSGEVSLKSLFTDDYTIEGSSRISIEQLAFAIARGGWPQSIKEKEHIALRRVYDYLEAVINTDVSRIDNVEKNPARVRTLLRSFARNISSVAGNSTLKNDAPSVDEASSTKTIATYLNALRRIFVIEDLPAWSPVIRSRTTLRSSPKRHFSDPSIAVAALRATPDTLLDDFSTFGLLFASLVIRDLRVYLQAMEGDLFHFRDRYGLEADAIIQLRDGRWAAVEVKMGNKEIEVAAANLKKIKARMASELAKDPTFLMIITASGLAYQRKDGVYVVPIGCLKN